MSLGRDELAERIVDAAIAEGERVGWENVRLRLVAERLGIGMAEVGTRFRDMDAVADAWFDRARMAVLATAGADLAAKPIRERLAILFGRWFDTLAPHRTVSVEMLRAKVWPFHPHHWVPMIFNLSRTILWIRDAAGCDAHAPRRELEEVGLTWLFLGTLAVWSCDASPGQERTHRFLEARLKDADRAMATLFGPRPPRSQPAPGDAPFAEPDKPLA